MKYIVPTIIFVLAFIPMLILLIISPLGLFVNRKYVKNYLLGLDQKLNVIFLGDPDETISSRIGKSVRYNGLSARKWTVAYWIYIILDKIDKNHSEDSIEYDEGNDALH
jgi:hypothetical protein